MAAVVALSGCGAGSDTSATAPVPPALPASDAPVAQAPASDVAAPTATATAAGPTVELTRANVENAFVSIGGCTVPAASPGVTDVQFALDGFGPTGVPAPNQPLDGSFSCVVEPAKTPAYTAARLADAAQAEALATWLKSGQPCHPIGTAATWVLFAAQAVGQPQASYELEAAVGALGGRMVTTCRNG